MSSEKSRAAYDPYGLTTSSGGTVYDPFLFGGMEQDMTGPYYSGGRYQSPRRPVRKQFRSDWESPRRAIHWRYSLESVECKKRRPHRP
jgi:hypothetical protein